MKMTFARFALTLCLSAAAFYGSIWLLLVLGSVLLEG